MAENDINFNFQNLGKSMKNYASGIIIYQVISLFVGIYLGIALIGLDSALNPEQALYNFIKTSKNIILLSAVMGVIIYLSFGNFIKEISNTSKNNKQYSEVLNKIFLIFLFGLITQIIVDIAGIFLSFQSLTKIQLAISSLSSMTETEFNQIINQVNTTTFLIKIINLIPIIFVLIGYVTFENFASRIKNSNLENPNGINIHKGIKFLLWGSIINLFIGLLDLIPNIPLLGLLGIVSLILTIVGLYKAGNGFNLYVQTAHIYKSPDMYASSFSNQNIYSQEQIGYTNQNTPREMLDINSKKCHICGENQVDPKAKYCSNCGTTLD